MSNQQMSLDLINTMDATAERARRSGALHSIRTDAVVLEEGGIPFLVRIARSVHSKPHNPQASGSNPFLPYEQALYVQDLPPHHVALLNKFNVVNRHLLIVTRAYEAQESLLTAADFVAAHHCLQQLDGLVFYNAGRVAGASQHHKHLQLIPRDIVPDRPGLPIETCLPVLEGEGRRHGHPFHYSACRTADADARTLHEMYRSLLADHGIEGPGSAIGPGYNLLLTRQWMMIVPRYHSGAAGLDFNAMAFAGSLFVKDESQLALLQQQGILPLLARVTQV